MLRKIFLTIAMLAASIVGMSAQTPDPNYHIYLCFGQSNMEGNASIEPIDRANVPERFKMMAAVNFNNPSRQMYNWYTATPPLVREYTGLTPVDWFGRTMCDNLPEEVKVGVIVVAIGGAHIEHLDKDFDPAVLAGEADWYRNYFAQYDNAPYDRLIACAKEAQKVGVIKGILLHQGCSNNGDQQWPNKVKKIYNDMLNDLGLTAEDVPLLAGEVVRSEMGGVCGGMNSIIKTLPRTIPTSYVISSENCPQKGDGLHFTAHGYRVLGTRYAAAMLKHMGIYNPVINYSEVDPSEIHPEPAEDDYVFDFKTFDPSIYGTGTWGKRTHDFRAGQYGFGGWEFSTPLDLSGYQYLVAEIDLPNDWTELRVYDTDDYFDTSYSRKMTEKVVVCELNGMMKNLDTGIVALDTKNVTRVGFWDIGGRIINIKHVFATNHDPYSALTSVRADDTDGVLNVYNLQGVKVLTTTDISEINNLNRGIYIVNNSKYLVR